MGWSGTMKPQTNYPGVSAIPQPVLDGNNKAATDAMKAHAGTANDKGAPVTYAGTNSHVREEVGAKVAGSTSIKGGAIFKRASGS